MPEETKLTTALYAVITLADFVKEDYREIAKRYRDKPEVLKEILLCACDGVDPNTMQTVEQKLPVDQSFSYIRRKHWEKKLFNRYHEELESIMHTVNSIESGMRAVSGQISVIEDRVPTMEELFSNLAPQEPEEAVAVESFSNVPPQVVKQDMATVPKEDVPNSGTNSFIKDVGLLVSKHRIYRKQKAQVKKQEKTATLKPKKEKEPLSKWFSELDKQGYTPEQLEFILSCIDEGMDRAAIERIIAPNLSIDIMKNLKRLELKKEEEKNGLSKRRGPRFDEYIKCKRCRNECSSVFD